MNAETFLHAFLPRVRGMCLGQSAQTDTQAIIAVLRQIAQEHEYHPRVSAEHEDQTKIIEWKYNQTTCKLAEHDSCLVAVGEFRTIDFGYYSRDPNFTTPEDIPQSHSLYYLREKGQSDRTPVTHRQVKWHWKPLVFIEHENIPTFEAARRDFFKLCLAAVPLRVFIGYGARKDEPWTLGTKLCEFYVQNQLQQVPDGETLVIIGRKNTTTPCEWHVIFYLGPDDRSWKQRDLDGNPIVS